MHPALVTAVATEQRNDRLARASVTRRARWARRVRRECGEPGPAAGQRRPQPCADLIVRQA